MKTIFSTIALFSAVLFAQLFLHGRRGAFLHDLGNGKLRRSIFAAASLFLLQLDTRESDGALRDRAAALGVRLGFLSEYAAIPSPAYAHTLVVNYAGLSPAALPEAMDLLVEIFGA